MCFSLCFIDVFLDDEAATQDNPDEAAQDPVPDSVDEELEIRFMKVKQRSFIQHMWNTHSLAFNFWITVAFLFGIRRDGISRYVCFF